MIDFHVKMKKYEHGFFHFFENVFRMKFKPKTTNGKTLHIYRSTLQDSNPTILKIT